MSTNTLDAFSNFDDMVKMATTSGIQGLKLAVTINKKSYTISHVGKRVSYWEKRHSRKLGRAIASKVSDVDVIKKLEKVYAKVQAAVDLAAA